MTQFTSYEDIFRLEFFRYNGNTQSIMLLYRLRPFNSFTDNIATFGKSEIIYADLIWEHNQEFRDYMNLDIKDDYLSRKMPRIVS